jgi:DNA-3-methyladenine glycosylase
VRQPQAESNICSCSRTGPSRAQSRARRTSWIQPSSKPFATAATFKPWRRPACLLGGLFARFSAMHQTLPDQRLRRLRRTELPVDTVELARYLIGKVAVHDTDDGRLSGRIVETEAYPVGDSAGHAFRGQTRRNTSLFLERGYAYVYFTYGSSFMLNVTSEAAGVGAGVLLRALEPLEGIDQMQRLRGGAGLLDLARGPGRLAQAMQIDFTQDGLDLCAAGPLWLATSKPKTGAIGESVRIGLTRNVDCKLRFYEQGSPYVSGPKRLRE